MNSPFIKGCNAEVFGKMLELRADGWKRARRNRLARARYKARKDATRKPIYADY